MRYLGSLKSFDQNLIVFVAESVVLVELEVKFIDEHPDTRPVRSSGRGHCTEPHELDSGRTRAAR